MRSSRKKSCEGNQAHAAPCHFVQSETNQRALNFPWYQNSLWCANDRHPSPSFLHIQAILTALLIVGILNIDAHLLAHTVDLHR